MPVHTAQIVADKLVTEFICRYGTPLRIHTDQGREFESKLFTHLCRLLEIEKSRTTPYRPQSDGMIERFNRTLQQMLAMFVNENHDDWDDHLPYLTSAYRTSVQESTKCTPNRIMLGRETSLPIDVMVESPINIDKPACPVLYVEWVEKAMQSSFQYVHEKLQCSFEKQKRYYDKNAKSLAYDIGSLVLRWYPPSGKQKLGLGWTGPYEIIRKISEITYEIKDCKTLKTKIVHVDHLKQFSTEEREEQHNVPNNDLSALSDCSCENEQESEHTENKYTRSGRLVKPPIRFS